MVIPADINRGRDRFGRRVEHLDRPTTSVTAIDGKEGFDTGWTNRQLIIDAVRCAVLIHDAASLARRRHRPGGRCPAWTLTAESTSMEDFAVALARWIVAERDRDLKVLVGLLDDEFCGDGPAGVVLDKQQWLDQRRSMRVAVRSFSWDLRSVRIGHDTAVALGVQNELGGEDRRGAVQLCTVVGVRRDSHWRIVNVQLSAVGRPSRRP